MKDREILFEHNGAAYRNTKGKVSWAMVGRHWHYQGSVEKEDWSRNFFVIPWPIRIRGVWCWVSLGMLLAWLETKKEALAADIDFVGAYSGGGPAGAILAAIRGLPAMIYGCPRFLIRPSRKALALFDTVEFIDAPFDIVTKIPPWAERGQNIRRLPIRATVKPEGCPWPIWITGHAMAEYCQLVE